MAKMGCFCALLGGNRKKKSKDAKKVSYAKRASGNEWQKVKPVESMDGTDAAPIARKGSVDGAPARNTKVVAETAAELGRDDIHGEKTSTTSVLPSVDLVGGTDSTSAADSSGRSTGDGADKDAISATAPDDEIVSGAVGRALPAIPSRLQRSCSNIETGRSGWKSFDDMHMPPPAKSRSHADLVALPAGSFLTSPNDDGEPGLGGASPASSVKTTWSADRVMLKRRSSSQVLPSRSRKLWWSMIVWSHRNLHRPAAAVPAFLPPADTDQYDVCHSHQQDGYASDTLGGKKNKEIVAAVAEEPTFAFSAAEASSSSLDRVSAWVSSSLIHVDEEDGITIMEIGESSGTKGHVVQAPTTRRRGPADATVQASSVVQTLNASSAVAHVSGMGLKVVPMISAFSSLRSVNLSGNLIGHISAGSLPKGLHSLDLSRNNIGAIEGLRELTRLRVLSLSYNRISRIGHGNQLAISSLGSRHPAMHSLSSSSSSSSSSSVNFARGSSTRSGENLGSHVSRCSLLNVPVSSSIAGITARIQILAPTR